MHLSNKITFSAPPREGRFFFYIFQKVTRQQIHMTAERSNGTMIVEFLDNISTQEQPSIKDWLENNKLQSSQIVKINDVNYNIIVVFENDQIVAIRVIK